MYYVEYKGFSATFTGDMSAFAEKNLIDDGKADKTNLLKVAHHGSNTATCEEWVEKLTPEYAVISVGENNPYNLPNDDVLERLENAQVFRTDYDGDIKFIIHKTAVPKLIYIIGDKNGGKENGNLLKLKNSLKRVF